MKGLKERCYAGVRAGLLVGLVLAFLTSVFSVSRAVGGQQPAGTTKQSFDAELVMIPVAVCGKKGSCAKGLPQDAFNVLSDKSSQEIAFFSNQDEPTSVAILLDRSGSMSKSRTGVDIDDLVKKLLSHLMQSGNRANEYILLVFNQNFRLSDWTSDMQVMLTALDKIASEPPTGRKALFDACYLEIEKAKSRKHTRHALILFTNGLDSSSNHNFSELRRLLSATNIVIYVISTVDFPSEHLGSLEQQGDSILKEMASLSGGLIFHAKSKVEMENAFDLISQDLHYQYLIGFKPKDSARDGKPHNITVKVALPPNSPLERNHVLVRSRKSYIAPK